MSNWIQNIVQVVFMVIHIDALASFIKRAALLTKKITDFWSQWPTHLNTKIREKKLYSVQKFLLTSKTFGGNVLYTRWLKFKASLKLMNSRKRNTQTPFSQALLTRLNYISITHMLVKRAYVTVKRAWRWFILHVLESQYYLKKQ